MKKKLLIVALITAVVLLAGTIVGFAVDAANKNAQAQAAAKAAEKEARIQAVLDNFKISPDSEAGKVLLEVLKKKEMTETDMQAYLNASEEMKKMNHAQVMAKLEEYKDIEETLKTVPWEEAMKDEEFMQRTAEMLAYRDYAQSIATGEALYEQYRYRLQCLKDNIPIKEKELEDFKKFLNDKYTSPDDVVSPIYVRDLSIMEDGIRLFAMEGEMMEVFDARKESGVDIDVINKDIKDLVDYIDNIGSIYDGGENLPEDLSFIKNRYLAGEGIEDIVG
ncbi:MAG: hypothetical protein IKK58_02735 [Clostridia bacterium]|nr:hypothetical protein [Clostridia bacterium]